MERRAAAADSTRLRILEAAIDLYRTQGMAATTVAQVAERADVARATVLNHFGPGDGLATAAIGRIASSLSLPTKAIFAGAISPPRRVRRLVEALYLLYERSEPWFSVLREDLKAVPAAVQGEQRFWAETQDLYQAALGRRGRNRRLLATVAGLTSPATFAALKGAGLSTTEAAKTVADLLATLVDGSPEG
jgi:AcrR family transcriptional regulator